MTPMTPDTLPILQVSNLCKQFGQAPILRQISLDLQQGAIKILIGPSGSGKSTLLQCMNCLVPPDSGEIRLEGKRIDWTSKRDLHLLRQQVGMIFQDFNLFDHLTALENVAIALRKVKQQTQKDACKRAQMELEQVGLSGKETLFPAQLSGGQKQRVAIARALAMDPKVLLLDEPTSALDPELIGEVVAVIRNLAAKGMTMIMATHQISLIASLANEILFMEQGHIVEYGSPAMLLAPGIASKTRNFCDRLNELTDNES